MPTVNINNKEIIVPEGTLILEAAKAAGFYIPTFCYQADLIGIGSCRMCIVEIEGQKKLQPSCITPVMDGMNILTETETVNQARADMLEFLLANHGLDCPVCEKGGECELQDMVYKYGPRKGRYAEKKYRWHEKDYIISPVIIKNSNRCVQCMKCVRVCREIVGQDVLSGINRGERQEETTFFKGLLDCDQDGNCIEVCPVGCFMRLPFRYKTRPWDLKTADTVCPYCATGCRMVIEERDGEVIRARAQLGVGINSETLCARGRFGYDFINHPERLTTPLLKKNGQLEPATWEAALSVIEEHLRSTAPLQTGGIASARLTNEELYLFQKLFKKTFNSRNIDSSMRWESGAVNRFVSAAKMNGGGVSIFDCMSADIVFIIGSHLSDENPVTEYMVRRMARERDTTVLIASPRAMKLDHSASVSLRHLPGMEKEVLEAIVYLMLADSVADASGKTRVRPEDRSNFETCLQAAEVKPDEIVQLTRRLKDATSVGILAGTEFIRFGQSTGGLATLLAVLNRFGKQVLIVPVLDRCNQRGAWEMGVHPGFGPGYRDEEPKGLGHAGMIDAAVKGDLGSLYIIREDPVATLNDREFVKRALSNINFLLVQDIFLTETAKLADCVLPGACFAEKEGTFTNQEGRVQSIKRLMKPPGQAKSDLEIIGAIGRRFDPSFTPRTRRFLPVFEQIRKEIPMYSDVCLDFNNQRNENNALDDRTALVKDSGIEVPMELLDRPPRSGIDRNGMFHLVTGNHLFYSGRLSNRSEILTGLLKEPMVEIPHDDAIKLGISNGEKVRVSGSRHEAVLTAKTVCGSKSGVAFIAENFEAIAVNRFFRTGEFMATVTISKVTKDPIRADIKKEGVTTQKIPEV